MQWLLLLVLNQAYANLVQNPILFLHEPIFTEFYYKKRNEGKSHRVALNHVAKKLIRIIYKLETENITFDSSKVK